MIAGEVPPDKYFYLSDGTVVKSISGLADKLPSMKDEVFYFHVTDSKNDFSSWIRYVVDNPFLAKSVERVKDKHEMARLIRGYHELDGDKDNPIAGMPESKKAAKSLAEDDVLLKRPASIKKAGPSLKPEARRKVHKDNPPRNKKSYENAFARKDKEGKHKGHHKKSSHFAEDDPELDKMLSEIDLGKQKDMLTKINERIKEMNKELNYKSSPGSKKALSASVGTHHEPYQEKKAGKTKSSDSKKKGKAKEKAYSLSKKKTSIEKSDPLLSKYRSIMNDDVKKSMRISGRKSKEEAKSLVSSDDEGDKSSGKRKAHPGDKKEHSKNRKHHEEGSLKIINMSDELKGIDDEGAREAKGGVSGPSSEDSSSGEKRKPKGGSGLFGFLKKFGITSEMRSMEKEKKAQESITVLEDSHLDIPGIVEFLKGLLVGMVVGMIFILIF